MKIHDVPQGTPAWWTLKLGTLSSSHLKEVITPGGKPSTSAEKLALGLVAETLTGLPANDYMSEWMERGLELQPEAERYFEFTTGMKLRPGGFITNDDGTFGCSPDALVYDGPLLVAGLEIKCPSQAVHMQYLLGSKSVQQVYKPQVQGSLYITGLPIWYTLSYHPTLPPALHVAERDEAYIEKLEIELELFVARLADYREELAALGCEAKAPALEEEPWPTE